MTSPLFLSIRYDPVNVGGVVPQPVRLAVGAAHLATVPDARLNVVGKGDATGAARQGLTIRRTS